MIKIPTIDGKSAAAQFLNEHEQVKRDLAEAERRIQELIDINQEWGLKIQMQEQEIARLQHDKDVWMQRAIELSSNVLYGADAQARAVKTAIVIANKLPTKSVAVSKEDVEELKRVLDQRPPGYDNVLLNAFNQASVKSG